MGVDFFRVRSHTSSATAGRGCRSSTRIQTNGTLIDDELAAFFRSTTSWSGSASTARPRCTTAYRVDRGGEATLERVLRGLETLRRHGVEYNTLTTLHRANADHPVEVYRYLRDECGSRFMQFMLRSSSGAACAAGDVPLSELGLSPAWRSRLPGGPGATGPCTGRRGRWSRTGP